MISKMINDELPKHWKVESIDNCCMILDSKRIPLNSYDREKIKGNIPYYGANGVQGYINKHLFDEDLILLAEDGGHFNEYMDRPIAYMITGKSWVNNHAHILKNKPGYDLKWIFYSLVHKNILQYIQGTTRPKLNQSGLKKIKISIPPILEQKKFVSILWNIDNSIECTKKLIQQTFELKKGLLEKLLMKGISHNQFKKTYVGFSKEKQIPASWETKAISDIANVVMGQSPKGDSYNKEVGTPLLNGPTEFGFRYPSPIQFTNKPTKICNKNDILLCVRGSTTGRLNLADREYCIGRGLASISGLKNKSDTIWLYYQFQKFQSDIYNMASGYGSAFPNITKNLIEKILLPLPSIQEQKKIAKILLNLDQKIQNEQNHKQKFKNLKISLIKKFTTGNIN
jgi:type I restriction enzyme, S subunit